MQKVCLPIPPVLKAVSKDHDSKLARQVVIADVFLKNVLKIDLSFFKGIMHLAQ